MCNRFIRLKIVQAFNHLHSHVYCLPHNFTQCLSFTSVHLHWLIELPTYVCRFDGKVLNPFFFWARIKFIIHTYIHLSCQLVQLPHLMVKVFLCLSLHFCRNFLFTLLDQRLPLITQIKRNSAFFVGKIKKKNAHSQCFNCILSIHTYRSSCADASKRGERATTKLKPK